MFKLFAVIGMLCIASVAQAQQQQKSAQQQVDPAKVQQCLDRCIARAAGGRARFKCGEACATGKYVRPSGY
jgi:uncharacterized low-complexity protein